MADQWAKARYLDASALVKLVTNEPDSGPVQELFKSNAGFCATSLCLAEALGVLKGKWQYNRISDVEYFEGTRRLVHDACGRIEVDDIGLFTPAGLSRVEAMAKKHSLDLSDALQLVTILHGRYSVLGPNSASILITAEAKLAAAALVEGIRVWNFIAQPAPAWV